MTSDFYFKSLEILFPINKMKNKIPIINLLFISMHITSTLAVY